MVCFICPSGLLRRLRLAVIDRHVSLLHAKKQKIKKGLIPLTEYVSKQFIWLLGEAKRCSFTKVFSCSKKIFEVFHGCMFRIEVYIISAGPRMEG